MFTYSVDKCVDFWANERFLDLVAIFGVEFRLNDIPVNWCWF